VHVMHFPERASPDDADEARFLGRAKGCRAVKS
jgi:hypothetical protein